MVPASLNIISAGSNFTECPTYSPSPPSMRRVLVVFAGRQSPTVAVA